MTINIIFAIIASVALMVVLPIILLLCIKNQKHLKIIIICLSAVYFCFLAIGVFAQVSILNNNFVVTFETTHKWFDWNKFTPYSFGTFNILINLYMLIPVAAIGIALFKNHKFLKTVLLSFLISLAIETLQFILPVARSVELTDLVYNTLSGIIGFALFTLALKLLKPKQNCAQNTK